MMMRYRHYALLSLRPPIVTAPRFWLLCLSLLALLAPAVAGAECVLDGTTVTCEGTDPDGFDAGGTDDLTVNVLPDATVDNGGAAGVNTLNLANGNTVDVQAGVEGESAAAEITASGVGSHGISAGANNTITNAGAIIVTGDDAIGMDGGDGNEIINYGTVTAGGLDGRGILLGDGYDIRNYGTITADGSNGIGVLLVTTTEAANELANIGTITGGSGSGAAISMADSDSDTVNLVTNRRTGYIDGSASGVAIRGGPGKDTVRNRGAITGDVQLAGGDDTFGFSTAGFIDDAFVVSGGGQDVEGDTLRLLGPGFNVLDLSIFNGFEVLDKVEGGTWELSGSGSFPEGTTVHDGALALDEMVNLTGDYVQGAGTGLVVSINPDGTNDRLVIDGNATIEEETLLWLVPTGQLVDDATYTFLTTTGTVTGLFEEVNFSDDTGVLRFFQVATANSLSVEFSRFSYASAASTRNQTATGIHLDEIFAAGPTGDMATVLASLDTLSTSELQAALDALHPEAHDAQANAILSFGRSIAELAAFRRPRCEEVVYERRPEIVAPSPCSRSWMPWGSAFGLFAKRNGKSGHIDFDHAGGGLLLGADHPLGEHFLVYGFLGGGYASVDVDEVGDGSLFSATLGAGARWSLGGSRIHGLVGYARGWHEQKRNIEFGDISRTAKADYASNLIMALVKAGHTFRFGSLDLEPLATVEYGYLMEDGFRESGAGDIDLDVDKRSNSLLSTTVGARLAYTFFKWEYIEDILEWADGVWTPEVTARWRGNWVGRERDLDARMVGARTVEAPDEVGRFTVGGQDAKQGVQVGAGVAFRPLRALMSIRVDYDGFYGDGSMIHRIGASIRVPLGGSAS